jgi:hypothetical protein
MCLLVKVRGQFVYVLVRINFLSNQTRMSRIMENQTSLHVQLKLKLEIYKTVSRQPQNTLIKFTYLINLDVHTITIKQE